MIERAIGIAGLGLAVIGPMLPTMFPKISKKLAWSISGLGLILIVIAAIIFFLPGGESQSTPPNVSGNCNLMACPDCDEFATQLETILRASSSLKISSVRNVMTATPFRGVALGVRDKDNLPPAAKVVIDSFGIAGGNLSPVKWQIDDQNIDAVLIIAQPGS
jgi:hypothetical protein